MDVQFHAECCVWVPAHVLINLASFWLLTFLLLHGASSPFMAGSLAAVSLTRQQVGIEGLTIEFPLTPCRGVGSEAGFNAVYFWSTAHCWVKNVAIINADLGVAMDGTYFCTVSHHHLLAIMTCGTCHTAAAPAVHDAGPCCCAVTHPSSHQAAMYVCILSMHH